MADNQTRFTQGMDRTLGSIPAGAAREGVRIADSKDIADLIKFIQAAEDVTRAHVINSITKDNKTQEEVTREYLSKRITEGAKPADVANAIIAALGTGLAGEVVAELGARLADPKEEKK